MKWPASNPAAGKNSYPIRIFLLSGLIILLFGLIGVRMFYLQIVDHSFYEALSLNQHNPGDAPLPKRGEIYLTPDTPNSQPMLVATNITANLLWVNQKLISDPATTAAKLAPLLSMNRGDVQPKLEGQASYVVLKKGLTDDVASQIQALGLRGVYLEPEVDRSYPQGDLASQALGFLGYQGDQRVGQYGIEGGYEKELSGSEGLAQDTDTPSGKLLTAVDQMFVSSQDGDNIYLTLDPAIQYKAQQVLSTTVQAHNAASGSVIVVNPKTGAILAMAGYPDFDPNNYNQVDNLADYSNPVISADYEPGSVFKAITLAAGIDAGKITPDTTFDNTGSVQVDDKVLKNASTTEFLGTQNMITMLDQSLNTGAVFAEQQTGNDTFKKYLQAFGFGKTVSGLNLPGQSAGDISSLNQKGDVFFATASFGQGITVTPLQLVQAYTALANGGKMVRPYLVNRIQYPDGTEDVTTPDPGKQVIDPKTASTVSAMLVDVIENGLGKKGAVPGYYIAGKTGTAQVPYTDRAGYDPTKNIGSFIGFGPVDNPQFLMLVRIDDPQDVAFAETTAAPAFGTLAQFILNYLQVPPSR